MALVIALPVVFGWTWRFYAFHEIVSFQYHFECANGCGLCNGSKINAENRSPTMTT
jgi:hypothetical protein